MLVCIYTDAIAVRLKWVACENHAVQVHLSWKCCPFLFGKIVTSFLVSMWSVLRNEWVWQPIWAFFVCVEGPESFLGYSWMPVDSLVAMFFVVLSDPAHTRYIHTKHTLKHVHLRTCNQIHLNICCRNKLIQKLEMCFTNNYKEDTFDLLFWSNLVLQNGFIVFICLQRYTGILVWKMELCIYYKSSVFPI